MEKIVLAIDVGTESVRAILVDEKGNVRAKAVKPFKYKSKKAGYVEANPDMFFEYIIDSCDQLYAESQVLYEKIEAVSITTQRDTIIIIDKDGKPIRDAIVWLDERKVENYNPIPFPYKLMFKVAGKMNVAQNAVENCHYYWIQQNEPENWAKCNNLLLLSTYLNFKFTDRLIDSYASTCGHIPFSNKHRKWEGPLAFKNHIFKIEREKLFKTVPPTSEIGNIKDEIINILRLQKGTKLYASGSDKACETLAAGCTDENSGSISLGSQTSIQTTSKKYYEPSMFVPTFCAVLPDSFTPEAIIYRGFWMVTWFIREFCDEEVRQAKENQVSIYDILNEKLKTIPIGADGLVLQPYFGHEITRPNARGSIIGFRDYHSKFHIYRAVIEGIGFGVIEGIEKIERKSKTRMKRLAISGGGANSEYICQIMADMTGREIYKVKTTDSSSAFGCAIAAFTAAGTYDNLTEAVENMVKEEKIFTPNKENHKKYKAIYNNIYKKMYKKLKGFYKYMNKFEG